MVGQGPSGEGRGRKRECVYVYEKVEEEREETDRMLQVAFYPHAAGGARGDRPHAAGGFLLVQMY
jgi:hypothetical protein